MYSFQPMVDATANDHTGFYFVFSIVFVLVCLILAHWLDAGIGLFGLVGYIGAGIALVATVYHESFKPEVVYANEKVIGTFVQFQAEGFIQSTGKYRTEKHLSYVVYEVNGNMIAFPADVGVSYPKKAVLYKN